MAGVLTRRPFQHMLSHRLKFYSFLIGFIVGINIGLPDVYRCENPQHIQSDLFGLADLTEKS